MENIFFLVLVGVVGLIRWLAQAAENKRNEEAAKRSGQPTTPPAAAPPARSAPQSEEERIRKFLDALGVPAGSSPSPKAQPRQVTPRPVPVARKIPPIDPFPSPRGQAGGLPPPLPVAPPPVAATTPLPTRETSVLTNPRPVRSKGTTEFEVHEFEEIASGAVSDSPSDVSTMVARLLTPRGLRDAIVLREILGPPRSMQPLERATVG